MKIGIQNGIHLRVRVDVDRIGEIGYIGNKSKELQTFLKPDLSLNFTDKCDVIGPVGKGRT